MTRLRSKLLMWFSLSFLLLLGFQNCSQQRFTPRALETGEAGSTDSKAVVRGLTSMEEIDTEVQNMIVDKTCLVNDDCGAIAYGSKSCGGPKEYLIYSTRTLDFDQLQQLTDQYTKLDRERNADSDLISTCDILLKPQVQCFESKCQALADGLGGL